MKTTAPVRAADLLQVGYWFSREARLFEITSWDPASPLLVEARPADTGDIQRFTLTELFAPQPPTQFAVTQASWSVRQPMTPRDHLKLLMGLPCPLTCWNVLITSSKSSKPFNPTLSKHSNTTELVVKCYR